MRERSILLVLVFCAVANSFAQVLPGASFLRILPGARLHSMSGAATAGLDEMHALYANPGSAGFLREWQWSAAYTKWIADVYNASFVYGQRLRTPWSMHTRVAFGILYQGMDEFDSTDGAETVATAQDALVSISLGQPLSILSRWLSLGLTFKALRSNLDRFSAGTFALDGGLFFRSPRFHLPVGGLGLFKYGILSSGLSLVNVGPDLRYISIGTPLPRTLRAGVAFSAGSHNGLQAQFGLDFLKERDDDGRVVFGTLVSWHRLISIAAGYDGKRGLMDKATIGFSINLDDLMLPPGSLLPGRNKAIRVETASLNEGEFFRRTYRGGLAHYAIGPEAFRFLSPAEGRWVDADSVELTWEPSKDPDLYDDVSYRLLVGADSLEIASLLASLESHLMTFEELAGESGLVINEEVAEARFRPAHLSGGDYFWAVLAVDSDRHYRPAERDGRTIAHFYVPRPDLIVEKIEFDYSPWITTDDYQGVLKFLVRNIGEAPARNVTLFLHDSVTVPVSGYSDDPVWVHSGVHRIARIDTGKTDTLVVDWYRRTMGFCRITATVDYGDDIEELNEENNQTIANFYTIPKGTFTTKDTTTILLNSRIVVELPFINEVCFDVNETRVGNPYLHRTTFDPPLGVLAERLRQNRQLGISLQGFADRNSEQATTELADRRSQAVRDSLIRLGVSPEQISITPGAVLPERRVPSDSIDARRIFEERRYVSISATRDPKNELFAPVPQIDDERVEYPVAFAANIHVAAPTVRVESTVRRADSADVSLQAESLAPDLPGTISWNPFEEDSITAVQMIRKPLQYEMALEDSLGRIFRVKPKGTFFSSDSVLRQHRFSFPLKFNDTQLVYSHFWNRIYEIGKRVFADPKIKMHFAGHACAIGSAAYNLKLSRKRAAALQERYLQWIGENHPQEEAEIAARLEKTARGYGEEQPLQIIRIKAPPILIGDNDHPIGRKFNRRIEIVYERSIE